MYSYELQKLLNLNEKDSEIYLDLLKFGASAASSISARTEYDRGTVYAALKRMSQHGVIIQSEKAGVRRFSAVEPNQLKEHFEKEHQQVEQKLNRFNKLMPKLLQIHHSETITPAIQFFEGADGVINLYELMLEKSKTHSAFLTVERLPKELRPYLTKTYMKNKKKHGVKSRVLVSESKRAKHYAALDDSSNRTTKIIPKNFLPFETEIIIGEKEIAIIDLKDQFLGVYIRSSSIRNTMQALFEMNWGMF